MGTIVLYLAIALFNVFVLTYFAYYWGYQKAKAKRLIEIGTADELVQDALNHTLIKVGRDDKVNVADIERYVAIVTKDGATFVNLDI